MVWKVDDDVKRAETPEKRCQGCRFAFRSHMFRDYAPGWWTCSNPLSEWYFAPMPYWATCELHSPGQPTELSDD